MREPVLAAFDAIQARIDTEHLDLVILCARRLPCLYQVMLDSGHRGLSGALVVSDRFLDVARDWVWKNVLIVDDTVVLGTTLTGLYDAVQERTTSQGVGGKVSTYAVCLDTDRSADYLLERLNFDSYAQLNRDDVEKFSKNVVTTLFQGQRPFFSDFPVSSRVTLPAGRFRAFVEEDIWSVADVTTSLVVGPRQRAYVQIPTSGYTDQLRSRLPAEVDSLLSAFKLRTWVTRSTDGQSVDVTFVPLALLGGATADHLDTALRSLRDLLDAPELEQLRVEQMGGQAKHRLLQMLTSTFLFAAAVPDHIASNLNAGNDWVDPNYLRLSFGPKADDAGKLLGQLVRCARNGQPDLDRRTRSRIERPSPSTLLEDNELHQLLWASRELLTTASSPEDGFQRPTQGQMTKVGVVAAHAINSLFGYISTHFEAGQQQDIRQLGNYDLYKQLYVDVPEARVLTQGFTMQELTEALMGHQDSATSWNRTLVSLGIDIGNDLGIVVPTTLFDRDRGIVYRAYRLGETAPLAGRPLVMWSPDAGPGELDDFSRTILDGAPALSRNVDFELPGAHAAAPPEPSWLEVNTLTNIHHRAFPGDLIALFAGRVRTHVRPDGTFDADLTSAPQLVQSSITLSTAQVPQHELGLIWPGAHFRWTVFERGGAFRKDRTSRIQFEQPRRLSPDAVEQSVERFAWLTEDDIDQFDDEDDMVADEVVRSSDRRSEDVDPDAGGSR